MGNAFPLVVAGKDGVGYQVSPALKKVLQARTPKKFIKKDPRGFDYVEIGYVRRMLDAAFPMSWSTQADLVVPWDVISKTGQLAVKVTLTVYDLETRQEIRRVENYGSSEVKRYKQDHPTKPGHPMDIGNDLKAAAADGLKKCASMLGIAQDIYEPKVQAAVDSEKP